MYALDTVGPLAVECVSQTCCWRNGADSLRTPHSGYSTSDAIAHRQLSLQREGIIHAFRVTYPPGSRSGSGVSTPGHKAKYEVFPRNVVWRSCKRG